MRRWLGTCLFLWLMIVAGGPLVAAVLIYRDAGRARRCAMEVGRLGIPFGDLGRTLADTAAGIGTDFPSGDRARASESARLGTIVWMARMEAAVWVWAGAIATIASAIAAGLGCRAFSRPVPRWSSPVAAWLSKRALVLPLCGVILGPALLPFVPFDPAVVSMVLVVLLGVAFGCATSAFLFAKNLPVRL